MMAASARLMDLRPGERLVYWVGDASPPKDVRDAAARAYDAGLVLLCQRRNEDGLLDYLAVGRRHPVPVPEDKRLGVPLKGRARDFMPGEVSPMKAAGLVDRTTRRNSARGRVR